jgi:hypothetical protein
MNFNLHVIRGGAAAVSLAVVPKHVAVPTAERAPETWSRHYCDHRLHLIHDIRVGIFPQLLEGVAVEQEVAQCFKPAERPTTQWHAD